MTYDKTTHRWYLTVEETKELGDIATEYGSNEIAERELKSQARAVYLWIYNRVPFGNKDVLELTLAKDEKYKPMLKEALLAQLEYDLKSGGNEVTKQTGINFQSGSVIPRSLQKERQVSIETQQIIENASSTVNILYAGDFGVRLDENRYNQYDY